MGYKQGLKLSIIACPKKKLALSFLIYYSNILSHMIGLKLYLRKLITGTFGQKKVNIPKRRLKELEWEGASWLVLSALEDGSLIMRKYIDESELEGSVSKHQS